MKYTKLSAAAALAAAQAAVLLLLVLVVVVDVLGLGRGTDVGVPALFAIGACTLAGLDRLGAALAALAAAAPLPGIFLFSPTSSSPSSL